MGIFYEKWRQALAKRAKVSYNETALYGKYDTEEMLL